MTTQETITLGAQTSREDTRTMKHVMDLRKLLATHCRGPYSQEVLEFALILRIGGDMQEFDFEGCERIRRNRKQGYITVDLGFPSRNWKERSDQQIREYIAQIVETGLRCCVQRLEKDKSRIDSAALFSDYAKAKNQFLAID